MLLLLTMTACSSPAAGFLACEEEAKACRGGRPADELPPEEDRACLCEEYRCRREVEPSTLWPETCKELELELEAG